MTFSPVTLTLLCIGIFISIPAELSSWLHCTTAGTYVGGTTRVGLPYSPFTYKSCHTATHMATIHAFLNHHLDTYGHISAHMVVNYNIF